MRLISYASSTGPRVAAVTAAGSYVDLQHADPSLPHSMSEFLSLDHDGLQRAKNAVAKGRPIESAKVKLLPPVPRPEKIICIGLNYADHAKETGKEAPPEP